MAGVAKIVSGGQTGVDTAALDFAVANGLAYGGWVPRGRTNEAGKIPARFSDLVESDSTDVNVRTRLNVETSDATLVFVDGSISPGTQLTIDHAKDVGKPHCVLDVRNGIETCSKTLRDWLSKSAVEVLNVGGPRGSESPEIAEPVHAILVKGVLTDQAS